LPEEIVSQFMVKLIRLLKKILSIKNLLLAGIIGSGISCTLTAEDFTTDPGVKLRFSTDTIFFDTIFSEIPSITKRLRVFNDQNAPVNIASIALMDPDSPYTLTVNGIQGKAFSGTKILGQDSMLVLIEASIEDRDSLSPYVVEDQLIFNTNGNSQEIAVLSWGQDANYLRDSVLVCNTTWTAGKPYVIYDHVLIDSLCTLNIEPGTRIFSHLGSNIFVKGSLKVNGTATERVLFMNDRFDGDFATFPGQWGGIIFLEGSSGNEINYADIRNAEVGIWLGTPDNNDIADLILENSIVENMSRSALLAFTSDLIMTNCLLSNAGEIVFAGLAGGNYTLLHNTIVNYSIGLFKSQPSFVVNDQLELADGSIIQGAVNLELKNNIIWGISTDEVTILNEGGEEFNFTMLNNLFRTTESQLMGFNNIIDEDPLFVDPQLFNFQLNALSPAIGAGADLGIMKDLLDKPRKSIPDIGAYEWQ